MVLNLYHNGQSKTCACACIVLYCIVRYNSPLFLYLNERALILRLCEFAPHHNRVSCFPLPNTSDSTTDIPQLWELGAISG